MMESPFPEIDAHDYQELRRDYPREAIDWVVSEAKLARDAVVLDAGAGTGQASRKLLAAGMRAISMEPAPNLARELRRSTPAARVIRAKTEEMPLRDGSLDAVVCAQSFQWFDGARAVPELHRVLRPEGALAVIWIETSEESSLHREMWAAAVPFPDEDSAIDASQARWRTWFDATDVFGPFVTAAFPFTRRFASADLPRFIATSSDIAVLPPDERESALRRVEAWASGLPPEVESSLIMEVNLSFRSG